MRNRHQAPENKHCRNISKQQLFDSRSSPWGAYFCVPCSFRLSLSDISRRQHQAGENVYCRAKPCGARIGAPPLKFHVQNIMFCLHCFTTSANLCFPAFFSPPEIDHSAGALGCRHRFCGQCFKMYRLLKYQWDAESHPGRNRTGGGNRMPTRSRW